MNSVKKNYVIISVTPWDFEYGSNIEDIAMELSKTDNVLFVNIPMKWTELISGEKKWTAQRKRVIRSRKNHFEKINDNCNVLTTPVVFLPINRLKSKFLFTMLNKRNNAKYAKAIQNAIDELGFDEYTLINDNDFYSGLYLPDHLSIKKSVYYLRDNFRAMEYWQMHSHEAEPEIIKKYDITLTNSMYLSKYASEFNPKSYYVGQGCEIDVFINDLDAQNKPEDLKKIPIPIIGYVGALNAERLDIKLIEHMAISNKNNSIVLVGPEDQYFKDSILHSIENIYFLGSKDFSELSNYMHSFDVCINPQAINQITIGNYPRKVDEYLAVGKPVIASYTETMVPFEEVTYLAKTKEEFSDMVNLAISENSHERKKERRQLATGHTWANSVSQMKTFINQT